MESQRDGQMDGYSNFNRDVNAPTKERSSPFKGQKYRYNQGDVLFLQKISFLFFQCGNKKLS
jgi:hypothetical protein